MHNERTGRCAVPSPNHRRARPGRGGFDMVRPPFVKRPVECAFIAEVPVAPIHWKLRRRNGREVSAGRALRDAVAISRCQDDHLMAKARCCLQLRLDVRAHAAPFGRIKGTDVDDPHRHWKRRKSSPTQVKFWSLSGQTLALAAEHRHTGTMSARPALLVSIHDVSPRFEGEIDRLLQLLRPHVGERRAMLVVPNHWGDAPIVPGSSFATRLRNWADAGVEMFLHGYFHRDEATHASPSDRLRARLMTAGEGEFL